MIFDGGSYCMRLQRIYSSKLYVTSSRKDKIHAAITNPENAELVQQLSEYLDDDAKIILDKAVKQEEAEEKPAEDNGTVIPSDDSNSAPSRGGGASSRPSLSGNVFDDFGTDELADIEPAGDSDFDAPESEPSDAVEESTIIGKTVTATSTIWTTIEDVVEDCDVIQGTLNAREDTKGANRLQVKDTELWIYFNDDVNLNDTMIAVIEVLNSTGYTYLAFSRLARSNNAIVFDINLNTNSIKAQKDIEK